MQKLVILNTLLSQANYKAFWATLDSDDLYADLIADVNGFEELMRVRIAVCVGQSCREVEKKVLEGWLALQGAEFERFVVEICGWTLEGGGSGGGKGGGGGMVIIPTNKENEAKGTVVRENVQFDREFISLPLSFSFSPFFSSPFFFQFSFFLFPFSSFLSHFSFYLSFLHSFLSAPLSQKRKKPNFTDLPNAQNSHESSNGPMNNLPSFASSSLA